MSSLPYFLMLLATHWVADFVLQTHWQASNKSKRNDALARHVAVYTAVLGVVAFLILPLGPWFGFVAINGWLHFGTDWCTSRWSSRLYAKQDWHNFFVVIGLDQLIHQFTLAGTMLYFTRAGA
jgi:protein-S-isoprenylcysteine O-methyltransferase Ste14